MNTCGVCKGAARREYVVFCNGERLLSLRLCSVACAMIGLPAMVQRLLKDWGKDALINLVAGL